MRAIFAIGVISMLCSCVTVSVADSEPALNDSEIEAPPSLVFGLDRIGDWKIGTPYTAFAPGDLILQYSSETGDVATGKGCETFGVPGMKGVTLMFEKGVLVRIDANRLYAQEGMPDIRPVISAELLASSQPLVPFVSNVATVKAAFGGSLTDSPHPYLEEAGSYLEYAPANKPEYGLILESYGDEITNFRSGFANEVRYIEGCL